MQIAPTLLLGRARKLRVCIAGALLIQATSAVLAAQAPSALRVTKIESRSYLVSGSSGNLVLFVDDTLSLVAGTQSPELVAGVRRLVDSLGAPKVRYVLMLDSDSAHAYGDGGWAERGAITIAHEYLWEFINRHERMHRDGHGPRLGVAPLIGFSEVLQLNLPNEEPHFVHRPRGIGLSDAIIHFERAGFVMMGNLIYAGEYPDVSVSRRSRLNELVNSIGWFADSLSKDRVEPVVPGRGRMLTVEDLREYNRMLTTAAARVQKLKGAGLSEDEVVARKPTAEFDAQWGHGRVTPEKFTRSLYQLTPNP